MYQIIFTDAPYVKKQSMRRCLNTLWFLFFVSVSAIGGDELSQSVDMTFTVNIEPPMCKLNNAELDVDFGEFQVSDIVKGSVKKNVEFSFTDCTSVNNVKISFSGDKIDTNNNFIRNKSGSAYASGVAIGLYDDKENRIQLKDLQTMLVNNSGAFNFRVAAAVLKESSSAVVTPGNIETSVNLNITYN
ncbi:fimbrial protein [Escherichia albertii]|uniref:fimbrial protein n=1 Tax=Escherichia albertii TaxID=208962 RepID=UPI001CB941EE|nr:fimbrial protein [Escherichia albertii]